MTYLMVRACRWAVAISSLGSAGIRATLALIIVFPFFVAREFIPSRLARGCCGLGSCGGGRRRHKVCFGEGEVLGSPGELQMV